DGVSSRTGRSSFREVSEVRFRPSVHKATLRRDDIPVIVADSLCEARLPRLIIYLVRSTLWGLGRVRWIDIPRIGRTESRNFYKYRIGTSTREVIHSARFRLHAPRRSSLQRMFIEAVAIPKLPGAGNDDRHAIIVM